MEKKHYIQPKIETTSFMSGTLMLPGSPVNGGYDPQSQGSNSAPARRTEVF